MRSSLPRVPADGTYCLASDGDREAGDAVYEVVGGPFRPAGDAQVGGALEQEAQHLRHLEAGQARAQAEVRPDADGPVRGRVEEPGAGVGTGETRRVGVAGRAPHSTLEARPRSEKGGERD